MAERGPASRPRPRTASAAASSAAERVTKPRTPPRSRSRSYQTPLRGNTSSSSSDDDDADARSWKSNGSCWGSDGSGVAGPSCARWHETAVPAKRDHVDVKKRVTRDPHRRRGTVCTTEEVADEHGFRNEDLVKAALYRPPMTLAEENRILKEELEIVKRQNHRLLHAERRLQEHCKRLEPVTGELDRLDRSFQQISSTVKDLSVALRCQICFETLSRPHTLSPCGHMACLACLKQWFMTPTSEEDPEDPEDPIHRAKTCPQCRTLVTARPVPVFLVKNIIHDLQTAGLLSLSQAGEADGVPPPEEDPWAEIFHSPCNCCGGEHPTSDEEYDESEEEGPLDDTDEELDDEGWDSDFTDEQSSHLFMQRLSVREFTAVQQRLRDQSTEWVVPCWVPPIQHVPSSAVIGAEVADMDLDFLTLLKLLRRGASKRMVEKYQMTYTRQLGITASVNMTPTTRQRVNLGWIVFRHKDDEDGTAFMEAVRDEIEKFPIRYGYVTRPYSGRMLVRLQPIVEVRDYGDQDSDLWMPDDEEDDEERRYL